MKLQKLFFQSFGLIFLLIVSLYAEKLPVRVYSTKDGLPNDSILNIVRDSRGFLWFCTGEGLSRFDGFSFKNYTQNEGLPSRTINNFLETRSGDLLIGTRSGLTVFNPNGKAYRWNILESKLEKNGDEPPMFRLLPLPEPNTNRLQQVVLSLKEDNQGRIFVGTMDGLFLLEKAGDDWKWLKKIESEWWDKFAEFGGFEVDSEGCVWAATSKGIFRILPDLTVKKISDEGGGGFFYDTAKQQMWVLASGISNGIRIYSAPAVGNAPVLLKNYNKDDGLPKETFIDQAIKTSDNRIILVDQAQAFEFLPGANENEAKFRIIAEGKFQTVAEDTGGNLWLGSYEEGVSKLSPQGFVAFDKTDGLNTNELLALYTNSLGEFYVINSVNKLSNFKNGRFETIQPFGMVSRYYVPTPTDFQTANGEWWIPSTNGLRRYPAIKKFQDLADTPPLKVYTKADGLAGNVIYNVFEDSGGDIWVTTQSEYSLHRWDRKSNKFNLFNDANGLPANNPPVAFAEDSDRNIWFGFYLGGLARFRNNKFEFFSGVDGIPETYFRHIYRDQRGRLWISTSTLGVFRVDNPTAEKPTFVNISLNNGLPSNQANCATEDKFGRIYIGTGHGLSRIEPETGVIKTYTQEDGLLGSRVALCQKDDNGDLWFGSNERLTRLTPKLENDSPSQPPSIFIGGISVGGISQAISELGQTEVELPEFNHRQNNLQINFFSIGFATAERMNFQYRLGDSDWSQPTPERTVTFANLAPANYEFAVRAVNAEGIASSNPSIIRFSIAPPTWQTWWFIGLCALALGILVIAFERYRAAKIKALKLTFQELRVSEERFRHLVEQSPLGIIILNPDGVPRLVNQAYLEMWGTGFTLEHFSNWDFMNDEQLIASGLIDGIKRTLAGETVEFKTVRYDIWKNSAGFKPDPDAGLVFIDSIVYPVKNADGELRELICILQNNTEHYVAQENLEKVRTEKARELEQVRKRIAADLHDDIGSSLTQISILSEVLQQNRRQKERTNVLDLIASSSRELVDAMSDIVWAINPQKDNLSDLTGKMRRFAADSFTPRKIKFTFDVPDLSLDIPLGANLRRELFLMFKESVNNIVKHSGCKEVAIIFKIENNQIDLLVRDNGCGFVFGQNTDGHGLLSMKERAKSLHGNLEIRSDISGTTIQIFVPLNAATN